MMAWNVGPHPSPRAQTRGERRPASSREPGERRTGNRPRERVELAAAAGRAQDGGMSSRIAAIAIDAVQPQVVADFWCGVLGWQVVEEDGGVLTIAPADGSWPTIDVTPVPEGKSVKNRLHLDLRADGLPTGDELSRLLDLGARRADVGQGADATWVVLADPEGNEFCLLLRTVQEVTSDG
jgi:hypothetical protein